MQNNYLNKFLLTLPLSLSVIACSPAATEFQSMESVMSSLNAPSSQAAVEQGDMSSSAIVPVAGSGSSSGAASVAAAAEVIPSNPIASGIKVTADVPFSFEMNSDVCVDYNGEEDMSFELLKDSGKIRNGVFTKLASDEKGQAPYTSYSVYALYADENGKLYSPSHIYSDAHVAGVSAYDGFNCLLQLSTIGSAAEKAGVPWKDAAQVSLVEFKVSYEENLVGFALRNQQTDALTMRCYK